MAKQSAKNTVEQIKKSTIEKVKIAVTDIDGVLRGKYLHKDKFLSAVDNGFAFCNVVLGWDSSDVCYDNAKYTGWHSGYPDANAQLDLNTFRTVPWDNNTPFFLGEFVEPDGTPLAICPRQTLKRVLAQFEKAGLSAKCGVEYEWFNFQETPKSLHDKHFNNPTPLTPGMFGYSLLRSSLNQPFFTALMDDMLKFGIPIEGLHTETGPGVYEAAILYSEALEAADRGVLFKTAAKEIGYKFGVMPSFMAKWNATLPGCSGHIHQSIWDAKETKNLFYESTDKFKMSKLFKSYIAGVLEALPEILPLYAPTVNSYKRLVDGFWAPTKSTWGIDNRTTAFRVLPGSSKSTRLETRVSGSDMNAYLGIAATLASGLRGIKKNMTLKQQPIVGSAYAADLPRLPRNLFEATKVMEKSTIARELFGEAFVDHFVSTRHWEWSQFQSAVTNWETQRYFEII